MTDLMLTDDDDDIDMAEPLDDDALSPSTTTATALIERLRRFYLKPGRAAPGGIFAHEVGENGQSGNSQRCDALFAGFTSSSGRILVGHEIKTSRADWQHELDQPAKADRWADACHQWWIVAPSTAVVNPATVPNGWGLMVPSARGTVRFDRLVIPHSKAPAWSPPWWAVRSLMARYDTIASASAFERAQMARRAADEDVKARVEAQLQVARGNGDIQGALAVELLAKYKAAGVDLVGYGQLSPQALAPYAAALAAGYDAQAALDHLTAGWRSVHTVERQVATLVKAVEVLRHAVQTTKTKGQQL